MIVFVTFIVTFIMLPDKLNVINGIISLMLGASIWVIYRVNKDAVWKVRNWLGMLSPKEQTYQKIKVTLTDFSTLWTKKQITLQLDELAKSTWLKDAPIEDKSSESFSSQNEEIALFWRANIEHLQIPALSKRVIGEILCYLDKHGSCPSVVSGQSKNYRYGTLDEKSTYDVLSKVPRWQHSLNTANEAFKLSGTENCLDKLLITSLAHDLGKTTGHNSKAYITQQHPENSIVILNTEIRSYPKLAFSKEISVTVKNHHNSGGDKSPLLKLLQEVDSLARQGECIKFLSSGVPMPETIIAEPPSKPVVNEMFRNLEIPASGEPNIVDISAWFDRELFIAEIEKSINKVKNGWFSSVTVNGDMVLVLTSSAWRILQSMAKAADIKEIAEIGIDDLNNQLKKDVLYSLVEDLRSNKILAPRWIKKGFFNGKFALTDIDGHTLKEGWYLPLNFETFEKFGTYTDYETRKQGELAKIVTAVVGKV